MLHGVDDLTRLPVIFYVTLNLHVLHPQWQCSPIHDIQTTYLRSQKLAGLWEVCCLCGSIEQYRASYGPPIPA